ncbi:MAG: tRNA threonylcarbamoyladenosine dehydratase [Clostridiales bacterium]|nr:tRNA threonylcarbamoyladenosine dehydratase [Clostridiales bacterium]
MREAFSRTRMLLGDAGMAALAGARVAVFGVGGVGSYAVEALARAGVGHLTLVDADVVCQSNLNRQLMATIGTLGRPKVDAMRERLLSIDPDADVAAFRLFYAADTADQIDLSQFDYVLDAIDTVSSKVELAVRATALGVPIISCMGAGNKLDPARFEVADLCDTSVCPLARAMRAQLRRRGIEHYKVVYSKEPPRSPRGESPPADQGAASRRPVPGSISFVPAAAGLVMAGEVVRTLSGVADDREETR